MAIRELRGRMTAAKDDDAFTVYVEEASEASNICWVSALIFLGSPMRLHLTRNPGIIERSCRSDLTPKTIP